MEKGKKRTKTMIVGERNMKKRLKKNGNNRNNTGKFNQNNFASSY